ncbi:hypothetical protein ACTA71_009558 [Dictyostelium dimigraforme]
MSNINNSCPGDIKEKGDKLTFIKNSATQAERNCQTILRNDAPSKSLVNENDGFGEANKVMEGHPKTPHHGMDYEDLGIPIDINVPITGEDGSENQWEINTNDSENSYSTTIRNNLLKAGFDNQDLEESSRSFYINGKVLNSSNQLTIYDNRLFPIKSQVSNTSPFSFLFSTILDVGEIKVSIVTTGILFIDSKEKKDGKDSIIFQSTPIATFGNVQYYLFKAKVNAIKLYHGKVFTVKCSITEKQSEAQREAEVKPFTVELCLPEIKFVGPPGNIEPPKCGEVRMTAIKVEDVVCKIPGHSYYKLIFLSNNLKDGKTWTQNSTSKHNRKGGFQLVMTIKDQGQPNNIYLVKQFRNSNLRCQFIETTIDCQNEDLFPCLDDHFTIGGESYKDYPNKIMRFTNKNIVEIVMALKQGITYTVNLSYDNERLKDQSELIHFIRKEIFGHLRLFNNLKENQIFNITNNYPFKDYLGGIQFNLYKIIETEINQQQQQQQQLQIVPTSVTKLSFENIRFYLPLNENSIPSTLKSLTFNKFNHPLSKYEFLREDRYICQSFLPSNGLTSLDLGSTFNQPILPLYYQHHLQN